MRRPLPETSKLPACGRVDGSQHPLESWHDCFVARAPVRRRVDRAPAPSKQPLDQVADGRRRVVIEAVMPEVDGGRFPAKRTVGETVTVEADIFADGHDALGALLRYRVLPIHGEVAAQPPEGLVHT